MVLKRKSSDSEISTASSLLSSPLSASNANFMNIDSQSNIETPSLFASRTRKRHRGNRPSESEVHQYTLSLLFSGAQHTSPPPMNTNTYPPASSILPSTETSLTSHQPSLHSFWTLPNTCSSSSSSSSTSSPSSISAPNPTTNIRTPPFPSSSSDPGIPTNCTSCDIPLSSLDDSNNADVMDVDMDIMMDMEIYGAKEATHACTECGRLVCHSCAVCDVGSAGRRCLGCAAAGRRGSVGGSIGRGKRWVGGLGWMD